MTRFAAVLSLLVVACPAPTPEDHPDGCLRCRHVTSTRLQEEHLCADSWAAYELVHACRCAPSAPCVAACPIWCGGGDAAGDAGPESGCAECVKAKCSAAVAACEAD